MKMRDLIRIVETSDRQYQGEEDYSNHPRPQHPDDDEYMRGWYRAAYRDERGSEPDEDLVEAISEPMQNPIKASLARELEKAEAAQGPKNRVPGYQQKGHHLNRASTTQSWSREWRRRALEDLPDSVASVSKVVGRPKVKGSTKEYEFLVFKDANGTELLAVQPRHSNSIYLYNNLMDGKYGATLAEVVGPGWLLRER